MCFGLLGAVGILHVASRSQVVDAAYRLSALESESRTLALANDRLKLELATLKRPARLEAIARNQLGMAPPDASVVDSVAAPPGAVATPGAGGRPTRAGRRAPGCSPAGPPSVDVLRRSSPAGPGRGCW